MPKGKKEKTALPPEWARCDFCGRSMQPIHWNSRTCEKCRQLGAPDQGLSKNYEKELDVWLKKAGKRKPKRRGNSSRGKAKPSGSGRRKRAAASALWEAVSEGWTL